MRVRMGWSGETDPNVWQKVDVELDEVDLIRMCHENQIPAGIHDRLPTKITFKVLQNEAEALLLHKLVTLGYPVGKAAARTAVLVADNNEIFTAVKNQLTAA